jgi:hypothetical protein
VEIVDHCWRLGFDFGLIMGCWLGKYGIRRSEAFGSKESVLCGEVLVWECVLSGVCKWEW